MNYKIDTGIPIPKNFHSTEPGPERQALNKLQPGESILFPKDRALKAEYAARNKKEKDKTWTYTGQKQPDGSRRIWRLT